ncbi:virulence RhuM family protein [Agrobacterium vitis]|uniref:virulence RhuM family protein n=1 Tax=Agrobacterium vitis TaxID=373 RepID=UPI003D2E5222
MADNKTPREGEILFYSGPEGAMRLEVLFEEESFWLTQKRMAELFEVTVPTINEHLKNIFKSGELEEEAVIRKFRTTADDGKNYLTSFYDLDAIIAVGYRVNSRRATQFRKWATSVLREFIIKGFAMDDERLKLNKRFGTDYFDELLERIREIRASERRFYLKITDIYQQCSIDYAKDSEITDTFFKTVQNKLHWAISGQTAAEIIKSRANASTPNMGLTTWKNAPDGKILKSDVSIAKNFLQKDEIKSLERIVSMYLDYAENQASRQIPMKMADWITKLDAFLTFNEYDILQDAGKVRHSVAKALAEKEFETFRSLQDKTFESDFERDAKTMIAKAKDKPVRRSSKPKGDKVKGDKS